VLWGVKRAAAKDPAMMALVKESKAWFLLVEEAVVERCRCTSLVGDGGPLAVFRWRGGKAGADLASSGEVGAETNTSFAESIVSVVFVRCSPIGSGLSVSRFEETLVNGLELPRGFGGAGAWPRFPLVLLGMGLL
jgi:hypothetical protein